MTRYLISFDDGAMTFPEEDLPDVAKAAHEVVQEAKDAGVWVFGGGLESQRASVVATDGTVTDGPYPETKEVLGGFAVVDVTHRRKPPRPVVSKSANLGITRGEVTWPRTSARSGRVSRPISRASAPGIGATATHMNSFDPSNRSRGSSSFAELGSDSPSRT
jgi:hypothetical protein